MSRVLFLSLIFFLPFTPTDLTYAGWGSSCFGGSSSPVISNSATAQTGVGACHCGCDKGEPCQCENCPAYKWEAFPDDPTCIALRHDGVQVGGYYLPDGPYRPFDGKNWGEKQLSPPVPVPLWAVSKAQKSLPEAPHQGFYFGVVESELNKADGRPAYRMNGKPVDREKVIEALLKEPTVVGGGTLPDDSKKLRLTAIGPNADQVLVDLKTKPELAEWKDAFVAKAYPKDHWAVARSGFVCSGSPTIYLETPEGKVLHRQDDYTDGAAGLAVAFGALRDADPNYKPLLDPDLRKQPLVDPCNTPFTLSDIPPMVWLIVVALILIFVYRSTEAKKPSK